MFISQTRAAAEKTAALLSAHETRDGERFQDLKGAVEKLGVDYTGALGRLEGTLRESIGGRQKQIDDIKGFLRKIMLGIVTGLLVGAGTVIYNAMHAKGIL